MHTTPRVVPTAARSLAFALLLVAASPALAADPEIHSVVEGRDPATDRPVLVLFGERLTKSLGFELWTTDEKPLPALELPVRPTGAMVVLRIPAGILPGTYRLKVLTKGDPLPQTVVITAGAAVPGAVGESQLAGDLRADLDDAGLLGGLPPEALLDAASRNAGTLPSDRFSALADLLAEKSIGTAAGQVAAGEHTHEGLYVAPEVLAAVGSVNASFNPLHWTKLKGVPAGFADGIDDLGSHAAGVGLKLSAAEFSASFSGSGVQETAARSDHDHDAAHWRRSDLDLGGTVNAPSNPLHWSRLKGVPAGFADGVDGDEVLSAGSGLKFSGTQIGIDFAGTGAAASAARSDHDHDLVHWRKADLDAGGTLNAAGNPVAWTRVKGVPSTLADGADANTTYSVGSGLTFSGTQFGAAFGGNGAAPTVARGDHDHATSYSPLSHDHDGWYPSKTILGTGGTVNDPSNPVAWSRLRGVPAGFADGTDDSASHTAGPGVVLSASQFALDFGGGGAAATVSRSDHDHDAAHWNRTTLGTTGTINAGGNPVSWNRLKGVPSGFADGTDVNTTYSAGAGLSLAGAGFSLVLGSSGSETSVSRSDHDHLNMWTLRSGDAMSGTLKFVFPGWLADAFVIATSASASDPALKARSARAGIAVHGVANGNVAAVSGEGGGVGVQGAGLSESAVAVGGETYGTSGSVGTAGRCRSPSGVAGVGAESAASGVPALVAQHSTGGGSIVDLRFGGSSRATISGSGSAVFPAGLRSTVTSDPVAMKGIAGSSGTGVSGANRHFLNTTWGDWGGRGISGAGGAYGVRGIATDDTSTSIDDVIGVHGSGGDHGVRGRPTGAGTRVYGVVGETTAGGGAGGVRGRLLSAAASSAVYAECTATGPACLVADHTGASGEIAEFQASGTNVARIGRDGTGYFNGGLQSSGADFAESVAVAGNPARFEPGDVMVVDDSADRQFALCAEKESRRLAGVYSTKPAMLGTTHAVAGDDSNLRGEIPLGIVGIVPTKVCDEGGPIRAGDLLVSASLPGHAMRAPAEPELGTILGKALGSLPAGRGKIEVLVSFQ